MHTRYLLAKILFVNLVEWWHFFLHTGQNWPPHLWHEQKWFCMNEAAAGLYSPVPLQKVHSFLATIASCMLHIEHRALSLLEEQQL
jgi:hypothetical protein